MLLKIKRLEFTKEYIR